MSRCMYVIKKIEYGTRYSNYSLMDYIEADTDDWEGDPSYDWNYFKERYCDDMDFDDIWERASNIIFDYPKTNTLKRQQSIWDEVYDFAEQFIQFKKELKKKLNLIVQVY